MIPEDTELITGMLVGIVLGVSIGVPIGRMRRVGRAKPPKPLRSFPQPGQDEFEEEEYDWSRP